MNTTGGHGMTDDEMYQRYLQAHAEDLLTNWRAKFYLGLQAEDRDITLAKLAAMPCSSDMPPDVKECWRAAIEAFHREEHKEPPRVRAAIICALYWAAIYRELPEAERWEQVEARVDELYDALDELLGLEAA